MYYLLITQYTTDLESGIEDVRLFYNKQEAIDKFYDLADYLDYTVISEEDFDRGVFYSAYRVGGSSNPVDYELKLFALRDANGTPTYNIG